MTCPTLSGTEVFKVVSAPRPSIVPACRTAIVATIDPTPATAIVLCVIRPEVRKVLRLHVVGIGGAACGQGNCAPADAVVVAVNPAAAVSAPNFRARMSWFHKLPPLRPPPDHCRSAVAVSKRENFTAVWEALSTYEKAAIRKLALGLDWEIPDTVRRRLRALGVIENGPDTRLTDAGWKLHRATRDVSPALNARRSS